MHGGTLVTSEYTTIRTTRPHVGTTVDTLAYIHAIPGVTTAPRCSGGCINVCARVVRGCTGVPITGLPKT